MMRGHDRYVGGAAQVRGRAGARPSLPAWTAAVSKLSQRPGEGLDAEVVGHDT